MLLYRSNVPSVQAWANIMMSRLSLVSLACLTLTLGTGCIAAAVGGAAAAGGIGYAYYKGALERNYIGPVEPTYQAARKALESLKLPITNESIEGSRAHLESRTAEGGKIRLWLEPIPNKIPANSVMTRAIIRVDLFGDRETSRQIFDAIDKQIGHSGIPPEERPVQITPPIQLSPLSPTTSLPAPNPSQTDQPERIKPAPMDQPGRLVPIPAAP